MIDRFELVLKKVPSIPQTRKKSSQSVETRLYLFHFQFRWRFPDKSSLYSKLYLIAFLVQFILSTLRTPLTDNRTEKFWEIASTPFWRENLHWTDQMFTCDAHIAIYFRHFSVQYRWECNAGQKRCCKKRNLDDLWWKFTIKNEVYLWPRQALLVFILEWGTYDRRKFANITLNCSF